MSTCPRCDYEFGDSETEKLKRLVKHAHSSVTGNWNRMQRESKNCKGVLATSAWHDALTQMGKWLDEVEELFPELKRENRI
jgi:hypothetical protein